VHILEHMLVIAYSSHRTHSRERDHSSERTHSSEKTHSSVRTHSNLAAAITRVELKILVPIERT
jgi:hypothetical protein